MVLQVYDIAFLLLFRHPVHQKELLATSNVRVELQKGPACVYLQGMRILMERLGGRIISIDKKRNVDVGSSAHTPLGLSRFSPRRSKNVVRLGMVHQIPDKTQMSPLGEKAPPIGAIILILQL